MLNSNKKGTISKVVRIAFITVCWSYIGYTIGKDAAIRDRRNNEKNNVQINRYNNHYPSGHTL
jgi:hypothetical protein